MIFIISLCIPIRSTVCTIFSRLCVRFDYCAYLLFDERELSIAALERNTGLSNGIIKKWKKQSPSCDKIIALVSYLNTSIEYLILGTAKTEWVTFDAQQLLDYYNRLDKMEKGIVLGKAEALAELAAERAAEERAAELPQKATKIAASAGTGLFPEETIAEKLTVEATPEALSADFANPINGDNIEKDFSNGDIVLVKSCPNIPEGQIGIFVINGDAHIKEYGGDCLISHKSKYSPIM